MKQLSWRAHRATATTAAALIAAVVAVRAGIVAAKAQEDPFGSQVTGAAAPNSPDATSSDSSAPMPSVSHGPPPYIPSASTRSLRQNATRC